MLLRLSQTFDSPYTRDQGDPVSILRRGNPDQLPLKTPQYIFVTTAPDRLQTAIASTCNRVRPKLHLYPENGTRAAPQNSESLQSIFDRPVAQQRICGPPKAMPSPYL